MIRPAIRSLIENQERTLHLKRSVRTMRHLLRWIGAKMIEIFSGIEGVLKTGMLSADMEDDQCSSVRAETRPGP